MDIPRPLADRGAREADRFIEAWLASAPERSDEGWTRSELEEHLREEHSTFSWLLEPMLDRAGFEIREASYDWARIYPPTSARSVDRKQARAASPLIRGALPTSVTAPTARTAIVETRMVA